MFTLSIMPALTHRNGWCWRIGVPKRTGTGAAEFKRWCGASPAGEGPVAEEHYSWPSRDILTPAQLQWAREHYSEPDFAEQFEASWEKVGGLVFHAFNEVTDVSADSVYDPNLPLVVGSDFNVDPMAWSIMQVHHDVAGARGRSRVHVVDELFMRNTNTRASLDELARRYESHVAGFDFYGDATSRARNTRASESDYAQIKADRRFRGARVFYPKSNPRRHDRFAACNAMLCNAARERRVLIHPRCRNLIRDLNTRSFKEGTTEPNDYGDVSHASDGFGYPIHRLFPVRAPQELGAVQTYAVPA